MVMKPLPLFIVSFAVAGFIVYAIYGYKHQHDSEPVYNQADQEKLSRLLDEPKPVKLASVDAFTYLYPDYDPRTAKSLPFTVRRK
jgi:hypothetical protein